MGFFFLPRILRGAWVVFLAGRKTREKEARVANTGRLYLVAGASGAGKSTILQAVANSLPGFVVLKKATTRALRADENEDTYFEPALSKLEGNTRFIIYATNGTIRYGIDVVAIETLLEQGSNALLVCVHHGAIKQLEEKFGKKVVKVFIHRDLTEEMKEVLIKRSGNDGGMRRLVVRERIYEGLATGEYTPDYIIFNTGEINQAVEQFRLVATATRPAPRWSEEQDCRGVLHLVVAATGTMRDIVQAAAWTLPGWGDTYCKKDTPTAEEARANSLLPGWMGHNLFGREYRLNPAAVFKTLQNKGVAFVMFSDIASARALQQLAEAAGFSAPMHYLHQTKKEVKESVKTFPRCEWRARLRHARSLKRLYETELILEAHPILPVNGEEGAINWVQRCIQSRPRKT